MTVLAFGWTGVLGAFAGLLVDPRIFPDRHGIAFLLGAVIAAVGYDIGGYAIGSRLGRHRLAPSVSPNKTWEGLIGGCLVAIAASAGITSQIHPWHVTTALELGLIVAVVAPCGDLVESMIKRDLGVKDMGSLAARPRGHDGPDRRPVVRAPSGLLLHPPRPHRMTGTVDRAARWTERARATPGDSSPRRVAVIGSTGSIGTQTLDVVRSAPDRFVVSALGASRLWTCSPRRRTSSTLTSSPSPTARWPPGSPSCCPKASSCGPGPDALISLVETSRRRAQRGRRLRGPRA